jgi:hypothetical protein
MTVTTMSAKLYTEHSNLRRNLYILRASYPSAVIDIDLGPFIADANAVVDPRQKPMIIDDCSHHCERYEQSVWRDVDVPMEVEYYRYMVIGNQEYISCTAVGV